MIFLAQIRALARSGSHDRAWADFVQDGLETRDDDSEILCLKGRLLKDKAKTATGADRNRLLRRSAEAYRDAADLAPATYPLINAATVALLGGQPGEARALAEKTLSLLDRGGYEPETEYWLAATRAEALLLLNRDEEAQTAMVGAIAKAPRAWEDHAATIGQFALILEEQGKDAGWLDAHRPPRSLHFQGIMGIAPDDDSLAGPLDELLADIAPGFGFGALAAGADILAAEALLRRGAELHILLPCAAALFRERSVVAVDPAWGPRFDALIEGAERVDWLAATAGPSRAAVAICEEAAMGLALRNARNLCSYAASLCICDRQGRLPASAEVWRDAGHRLKTLSANRSAEVPDRAAAEAEKAVALVERRGGDVSAFSGPAEAAAMLDRLAGDEEAVALDYGVGDGEHPEGHLRPRLAALLQVARPGQIVASRTMAMALGLHAPHWRAEEAGELRWEGGALPFFNLIRARQTRA